MTAGRKPKPTELKILQGNPGRRPLRQVRKAQTLQRTPSPPDWLTDIGRAEWRRVGKLLSKLQVLTDSDLSALAAYCDAYSRWRKAREMIEEQGITTETGSGNLKAHPATVVVHQAMTEMRQFMVELGLTPSSRTRVNQVKPNEPSEFEQFLAKRRTAAEGTHGR